MVDKTEVHNLITQQKISNKSNETIASAAFLTCVATGAGIFAFASTLASARKTDPNMFAKGQTPSSNIRETGVQLAIRALKWGSFYAIGGCGLFFFGIWKMSGANDLHEFRMKIGSLLPRLTPKEHSSKTEFDGLSDLMTYLATDYSGKKKPEDKQESTN
ncbi:transmembrane protein 242 [Daktulosphaira vitifoliae]|uniref:transmembrane protein 242 n=1 Tax=Daktulosphaira vitifoliae TaxID=58002 RepID=UPI0021AAAF7D|nr:transmembrane protein 242 [Daktulosphaira vitifoliae]XP_050541044.1 transmembrane protein 242 [Daktulosphaira vitifoliae]XP_050541045.1 transmembrane protein 242 [Daktulosphaira vitifoliae]